MINSRLIFSVYDVFDFKIEGNQAMARLSHYVSFDLFSANGFSFVLLEHQVLDIGYA